MFFLDIGAKAIIFTWVFFRTHGSVLIAVLLHTTNNVFGVSPVVSETGSLTLPLIATGLEWLLAALLLVRSRTSFFRRVHDPDLVYVEPDSLGTVEGRAQSSLAAPNG